jgi:hypothetical protein
LDARNSKKCHHSTKKLLCLAAQCLISASRGRYCGTGRIIS